MFSISFYLLKLKYSVFNLFRKTFEDCSDYGNLNVFVTHVTDV